MSTKAPWVSKTPGGHKGAEVKKGFGVQKDAGCPIRRRVVKKVPWGRKAPGSQEGAVGHQKGVVIQEGAKN